MLVCGGRRTYLKKVCKQCCTDIYQCWAVIKNSIKPSLGISPGIRVDDHSYPKKKTLALIYNHCYKKIIIYI
jgi:hypothetical protein